MKIKETVQTVGGMFASIASRLEKHSDTPALDSQGVIAHVLEKPGSWVMANPEIPLPAHDAAALESLVKRLENGEPLPYILGRWEFFGLPFNVTPDVLIPRPETEIMVERAIAWLQQHPDRRLAADVGTGSGCIGISLAVHVPDLEVMASDISSAALKVAMNNAVNNSVAARMEFLRCNLLPPETEYDLIVANLPYIPTKTLHRLPIYGREPTTALDGGADGLQIIRNLLTIAPDRLIPGGLLLMEIEASEGPAAISLACDIFAKAEIHLHKDLAGRDRLLEIQV